MHTHEFTVQTSGRGFTELSLLINRWLGQQAVDDGLLNVFCQHTSASLMLCENADPDVLRDLETWMQGAVLDGDARFRHRLEGDDDMSAHIRSVLTASSVTIPVCDGALALGIWQGVFLWEHRYGDFQRRIRLSLIS